MCVHMCVCVCAVQQYSSGVRGSQVGAHALGTATKVESREDTYTIMVPDTHIHTDTHTDTHRHTHTGSRLIAGKYDYLGHDSHATLSTMVGIGK